MSEPAADSGVFSRATSQREAVLESFEAAWGRGERPRIEDFLPVAETDFRLLAELAQADLAYRLRSGEPAQADEYLSRFLELASDAQAAVELIVAEYRLSGSGADSLDDYLKRYPHYSAALESRLKGTGMGPPVPLPPAPLASDETGHFGRAAAGNELPNTVAFQADRQPENDPTARGPDRRCTYPRMFGDYELLGEVSRGGMGVVYKARQARLNRTVAVKMIRAGQLADDEDVRRFYNEAEAAAALDHPQIVPIFECGDIECQHYYSMAFVDGQSLAKKLAVRPLPVREAAQLVRDVAQAVEYAHQRGVIHRDLKPGNILLDENGEPRVTDFGLARRIQPPHWHGPDSGHAQLHAARTGRWQERRNWPALRCLRAGRGSL